MMSEQRDTLTDKAADTPSPLGCNGRDRTKSDPMTGPNGPQRHLRFWTTAINWGTTDQRRKLRAGQRPAQIEHIP